MLYRGVSKTHDKICEGKLQPSGGESVVSMKFGDPELKFDGTHVVGLSEQNTVRAHQLESGRHNGCFISTTRNEDVAHHFATSDNAEEGYVYVIDEEKLEMYDIIAHEKIFEENSHESEVSLRSRDNGELPYDIVIDKYEVKPKET